MKLDSRHRTLVTILLLALAAWDLALWLVATFHPELWMEQVHGQPMPDPMGLLARTGAVWLAFAILQFVAALQWNRAPFWLCLVAGMRLSELLADWAYLASAERLTTAARVSLTATPVANIVISLLLLWVFFRVRDAGPYG